MQVEAEEIVAVRREILDLLRRQMQALDSPLGLTDEGLRECYDRQARVQELREKLEASSRATATTIPPSPAEASFSMDSAA
ncbi:MAG: hypothetical protein WB523_13880 [Candidatus Sulfotelmatobacter sp.]